VVQVRELVAEWVLQQGVRRQFRPGLAPSEVVQVLELVDEWEREWVALAPSEMGQGQGRQEVVLPI
jgi:hypothetical protein